MLEIGSCMDNAKSRELIENRDDEFADISFEELLAQEKKDSFCLWIVFFSYVGNYFWTHYFFTVLGASYTFPSLILALSYFIAYLETLAISNIHHHLLVL
ncbi:hypothetical protein AAHE18_18G247800 [Arachis hypogaea]